MKKLTGFAAITCDVGKKIAYTYSIIDENGNITSSNNKESFVVVDETILEAITTIENNINARIAG